jgi:hypothetical protein
MISMDCKMTAGPVASMAQAKPSRKKANRRLFITGRYAAPMVNSTPEKR